MAKKSLPIETLGSVLEQSLKRLDLVARLDEYAVWPIWNEVVGAVIAVFIIAASPGVPPIMWVLVALGIIYLPVVAYIWQRQSRGT